MPLNDFTALARPIDPSYPTNRVIALLALVVVVGGTASRLLAGAAWIESASWGVGAGFAVFLAWALARELDPDHDLSAFVAAGLMLIGLLFFDLPALLALFWMLLTLRVVNRTVGLPSKLQDSLLVLGLGGWLTWQGNWMFGLVTAVAFLLDSRMPPALKRHLLFAGVALVVTAITSILIGIVPGESGLSLPVVAAILVTSALFVIVIAASRTLSSAGDETGEPLNPGRVQAGQVLALLTATQVAWWDGRAGLVALLPLWAAMLGVALYRLFIICALISPPRCR
jgi:hypothetical protein